MDRETRTIIKITMNEAPFSISAGPFCLKKKQKPTKKQKPAFKSNLILIPLSQTPLSINAGAFTSTSRVMNAGKHRCVLLPARCYVGSNRSITKKNSHYIPGQMNSKITLIQGIK